MRILYSGAEVGLEAARGVVGARGDTVWVEACPHAMARGLADADALLDASMKVRITDAMLESAPRLRIISCATTGADHIDRTVAERRGIPVRTLREDPALLRRLTPAAELSWALLMACARRLPAAAAHVKAGHWEREAFPGVMLQGKQLGLVGCGRIGSWMARYARAFDMRIVGYDPYVPGLPEHVRAVSLRELVRTSDFISVHVHLSEETRGLLSDALLAEVKPGAVIVNTSRGGIVSERGLVDGLGAGRLAGVGLDVLESEPEIERSPLLALARAHDNVIITPHCGGFSPDAVAIVCTRAAEKILEHFEACP